MFRFILRPILSVRSKLALLFPPFCNVGNALIHNHARAGIFVWGKLCICFMFPFSICFPGKVVTGPLRAAQAGEVDCILVNDYIGELFGLKFGMA